MAEVRIPVFLLIFCATDSQKGKVEEYPRHFRLSRPEHIRNVDVELFQFRQLDVNCALSSKNVVVLLS